MKAIFGVVLLVAVALAEVKVVENEIPMEMENTAFNYHERFGVAEAARIKAAESKMTAEGRIVGGSTASIVNFVYQAGLIITLTNGWTSVCGASLISNTRLLTAAHCWWDGGNQASSFQVVLGSNTLFTGGTRRNTNQVTMHGSWNPSTVANDIAIININWVNYSNNIRNIALPTSAVNQNFAGSWAVASGYGTTVFGVPIPSNQILRQVSLNVMTNNACNSWYNVNILSSHICTSGSGGVGTCSGDSGGPLAIDFNGQRIHLGTVSFGSAAGCNIGTPSVFARTTSYISWIQARL